MTTYKIICSDALTALQAMPDNSIDSYVVDPPAGIHFMNKAWDDNKGGRDRWIEWLAEIMAEALRVIKPGGHALVWALPRTSHWTGMALEMAGWEIRDRLSHLFGSGFPKSLDVGKAIDKAAGVEREVVDYRKKTNNTVSSRQHLGEIGGRTVDGRDAENAANYQARGGFDITTPATDAAKKHDGKGTALKPAVEDW